MTFDYGQILEVECITTNCQRYSALWIKINNFLFCVSGDPLYVGMDLTIASFDHISEVNMVSFPYVIRIVNCFKVIVVLDHEEYLNTHRIIL